VTDVSRSEVEWGSETPGPLMVAGGARPRRSARWLILVAVGLLVVSAALHIVTVFPVQGHLVPAFDHHAYLVVQQVVLTLGWLLVAVLVARGRPDSVSGGAALAVGIALAELGIVVSNLSEVLSESTAGAGAWLFVLAWAVGLLGGIAAIGAALAARIVLGRPGRLPGRDGLVAVAGGVLAIMVGVALLPAWDHYVITSSVLQRTLATQSLGSAFAAGTPVGVLIGDLLSAVAFALVPLIGLWWRPGRVGALVSYGVLVVVLAQLASGLVGFRSSPSAFGITAAQVSTYGVRVHSSLTSWFVIELLAGAALALFVLVRWLWASDDQTPRSHIGTGPLPPGWAIGNDGQPVPVAQAWGTTTGGWGPPVSRQPDLEHWARQPDFQVLSSSPFRPAVT
jgi:hypothetical protein